MMDLKLLDHFFAISDSWRNGSLVSQMLACLKLIELIGQLINEVIKWWKK